jgi:hypothetical protein
MHNASGTALAQAKRETGMNYQLQPSQSDA